MIIVLNGPLGIGKSTLAAALAESIDQCVMLDGDHLIATNPPPVNETDYLHFVLKLLLAIMVTREQQVILMSGYSACSA